MALVSYAALCQEPPAGIEATSADQQPVVQANLPPRVAEAKRFLAQRGWSTAHTNAGIRRGGLAAARAAQSNLQVSSAMLSAGGSTTTWQSLGPAAVQTSAFGLVTGRVSALALDPADATGNRLYVGTTGGGVWVAQNAATGNTSSIVFTPLTDSTGALNGVLDASISIGALTVQPGGTGVILAGTGDPNDVLDSYYGGGILRSMDGGNTWTLISRTLDVQQGLGAQDFRLLGEGVAGFAWSTANPQLVVAAVSQAYEGLLVDAPLPNYSSQGLYYSQDAGATWHFATISDGGANIVQGPFAMFVQPDGNAATSVVWNPVRKTFIAAVRFHGYYQSSDGVTWTRMTAQPGTGFTTRLCPTNPGLTGSIACPIYRGTLAVNPTTGDTFAWTVDLNNQDQGLWQDQCGLSGGVCSNQSITFSQPWSTTALETNTMSGAATIADGDYTLGLAAVPSSQDTILLAGADDLWKCSLAMGCVWRNTTNATTCKSAGVGEYQHALVWNPANPLEIFAGNDSGLWRSMDAIGETGPVCGSTDASHFQNLNANLGSLAEVVSFAQQTGSSSAMMAGLGVNGTAGVKGGTVPANWPQILSGYGGPVAMDATDSANWYVNNQAGVAIYRCSQAAPCTPADFGASPVVNNADVGNDGLTMPTPAPFLVDPLDASQLLIGTCRVWRGSASGSGWTASNAVSAILDSGATTGSCHGDALIRSIAAIPLSGGVEKVYVGMFGALNGGANLAGHVLSATLNPASSTLPKWPDLTLGTVTNDINTLNRFGYDVSSIFIDPHDGTGNTVYVTVEAEENSFRRVRMVYRTTDGGAHWADLTANLPDAPVSGVIVDPQDANTVYLATDVGVYLTNNVANCVSVGTCWSVYGTGMPAAPVVGLSTSPLGASSPLLFAATYGRGIWQAPLSTSGVSLTTATVSPSTLTFSSQTLGSTSSAQTITVQNTGSAALTVSAVTMSGDFSETDNCTGVSVATGASCAIEVQFTPGGVGTQTGTAAISANFSNDPLSVSLTGTGAPGGAVTLTPPSLDFGVVGVGTASSFLPAQANNSNGSAVGITSLAVTGPFSIATNSCGTVSLAANTSCQIQLKFLPTLVGAATGTLTLIDAAGTQTVSLAGTGASTATDNLNATSLSFSATAADSLSPAQTVTLTNAGDLTLTSIAVSATGSFQSSSTCGAQLAGHSSCSISVIFAPTQQGTLTGVLSVTDLQRTQTVSLSGTGVPPAVLSVVPSSLAFSAQQTGVTSAPQTLTISNTGGVAMANVGFQITGAAAAAYALLATNCGATLNSGASCAAQVTFTPPATGSISAILTVSSSTSGVSPVSVGLNGSGLGGTGLIVSPSQLAFSTLGVGQSSSGQTVTLTNNTGSSLASLTLAVSAPFGVSQNSCTGRLAPGAACTAVVTFQPTASGAATGTLTVTSPGLAAPVSVALSGTGFDFTAAISGSGTMTVAGGQTANYNMTLTPANGAQGVFTYTCGTLPANAVCTFNPASTTVGSGATGNVTVQVATGKTGTARLESPARWQMAPLTCAIVLLPLALYRRRKLLLMMFLVAVMAGMISSCASSGEGKAGSGGSGGGSATPAGTYTIPVTFTSTGVSHVVNVTLTVD